VAGRSKATDFPPFGKDEEGLIELWNCIPTGTCMRGYDLPPIVKLLKVYGGGASDDSQVNTRPLLPTLFRVTLPRSALEKLEAQTAHLFATLMGI
jgi:hypothetical protein